MQQSFADFSGRFRLKGKSSKTFDMVATKYLIFNFGCGGFGGAAEQPPTLGCAPVAVCNIISSFYTQRRAVFAL